MKVSTVLDELIKELKDSGISSAVIDSEILLSLATGKNRKFLLTNPNFPISQKTIKKLKKLSDRRKKFEPIAYILGYKEFFGLNFFVNRNVLIPRPETEILVEESLKFIQSIKNNRVIKILDIGTGSGNIIISIAKNVYNKNNFKFYASDITRSVLNVARKNAKIHRVKINFIQSDLLENIKGKFDLITANLPYVPKGGSDNLEIKYEPHKAIFTDDQGMLLIKKFLMNAQNYIKKNGMIVLELDPRNADKLEKIAKKYFSQVLKIADYSQKTRVLKILT